MITVKTDKQISNIHVAGSIIKHIFATIPEILQPSISTSDIDAYIHQSIIKEGGTPSFLGYHGFPASCCVSINDEIIHGRPSKTTLLASGDVVSIDVGVMYQGGFADSAHTFYVGDKTCTLEIQRLLTVTKEALFHGIAAVKPQNRISDIARAIYACAKKQKLGVVREYCGHGVGNAVHEAPNIPNYYPFIGQNARLIPNMVIAIEPMFSLGANAIIHGDDNFTVKTADAALAAHFEHTVLVTQDGYNVLT